MKNCQIKITDEAYAAIQLAANARGLTVAGYVRMLAIIDAGAMGFHAEPPRAD